MKVVIAFITKAITFLIQIIAYVIIVVHYSKEAFTIILKAIAFIKDLITFITIAVHFYWLSYINSLSYTTGPF